MILLLVAVDLIGSFVGIRFLRTEAVRAKTLAITSGLLAAIALLWMLPEMGRISGIPAATFVLASSLAMLLVVDRYVYPVCPCCSHRKAAAAQAKLLTMTAPMMAGICVHNLFDGWTASVASESNAVFGSALLAGNLIHKLPESLVIGILLRSVTKKTSHAFALAGIASLCLLAGAFGQKHLTPMAGGLPLLLSLGMAGGSFLFIGIHTFKAEYLRTGARGAIVSLLIGFAVSALVQGALMAAAI